MTLSKRLGQLWCWFARKRGAKHNYPNGATHCSRCGRKKRVRKGKMT